MKVLLIIYLIGILSLSAFSQDSISKTRTITTTRQLSSSRLDTNMIVYDGQGNALRYYQYSKLMNTGDYTIGYNGPPGAGSKPVLKKINPQLRAMMYQMLKKQMAIKNSSLQPDQKLDITPLLEAVNKEDLDKKVVVLIFWNPDCPPCTEAFATISDFFRQIHNPENAIILAITAGNELVAAVKLKEKPLLYARLVGNAGSIVNAYNIHSFPSYVVADKDHIIRFAVSGESPITMSAFKDIISEILIQ